MAITGRSGTKRFNRITGNLKIDGPTHPRYTQTYALIPCLTLSKTAGGPKNGATNTVSKLCGTHATHRSWQRHVQT